MQLCEQGSQWGSPRPSGPALTLPAPTSKEQNPTGGGWASAQPAPQLATPQNCTERKTALPGGGPLQRLTELQLKSKTEPTACFTPSLPSPPYSETMQEAALACVNLWFPLTFFLI